MGKLLHSKTFRVNLAKWFVLYILALLIVTGVVTYSKYISSMGANDEARTASFKVSVSDVKVCSTTSQDLCDIAKFKPYDELEYRFTVDTTKIEVSTEFFLTLKVNDDFIITKLEETERPSGSFTEATYNSSVVTLDSIVGPSKVNKKEYKVKVKYKDNTSYQTAHNLTDDDIMYIGYSAIQIN